jgi:hypothetical protein
MDKRGSLRIDSENHAVIYNTVRCPRYEGNSHLDMYSNIADPDPRDEADLSAASRLVNALRENHNAFLACVILLGGILRFAPGMKAHFPINDGGMFLTMILDLQANGFALPRATSYNFSDIPYAYPPLGFYLVAFLSRTLGIPPADLLIWLPAVVSVAIIPAFYGFSLKITGSKSKAMVAASLYAVIPGVSDWLIMGGGLTRSLGILFLIIGLGYVYVLVRGGGKRNTVLSIFFCSLAVLSHPEAGLQTAGFCLLLWLLYGRRIRSIGNALALALGVGAVTSVWWMNVLRFHGFAPFTSAMQTGIRETLTASLFHTFFSLQGALPLLPVFGLVGMYVAIKERNLLPVIGFFLPFVVDPRNAPAVAIFPLLILSVEGMVFLRNEYERSLQKSAQAQPSNSLEGIPALLFGVLLTYFFAVSISATGRLASLALTVSDRETLEWVRENTPAESRFLLMTNTGQINPMTDAHLEWFPSLAARRSLNTLQGLEWTHGSRFYQYSRELIALQACVEADCIQRWLGREGFQADYILVLKRRASPALVSELQGAQIHEVVYESSNAIIVDILP